MFRRILIANRGEVGARILRTCRRLGVEAVAVASSADRDAAWLADADDVVCIGGPRPSQSYLDADALIETALHKRCSAVHPGWGFLSENAAFAVRCRAAGLTFIGPSSRHLRDMGDKVAARRTFAALGLDPIPGSDGAIPDVATARKLAAAMGYPVLLKALAGGGGRGMRGVESEEDLDGAFRDATLEATSAFGDGRLYLERRIDGGRHVEVQVMGDAWGHAVHVGERECSIQRRHQKVIEESPSPGLSTSERERVLPRVAEAVARAGYEGAGTVEMLLDSEGRMWFMEMNTRLQVEHGVSEERFGVDLVEWQLRVAANEPLPRAQDALVGAGHVVELRINAEDPENGFRPSPGVVAELEFPVGDGVRVDTHLRVGDAIPPWYDSMVAKVLVKGSDRPDCVARARRAVAETRVAGVKTNLGMLARILEWEPFVSGRYDTKSLERDLLQGA